MQTPRDPSMEDILASIKRVIADEKELRAAVPPPTPGLDEHLPRIVDEHVRREISRITGKPL